VPFCPKCESEYEAGVERCADCNEALVAHVPHEEEDTEQEIICEPSDRLVQVAVFNHAVEAHLCKTRLESEGIKCFIAHEHFGGMHLFRDETSAVRLQVGESDTDRAIDILRQEPLATDTEEDTDQEDIRGPCCPRCGSPNISSRKHWLALIFIWLLLPGIAPLFTRKRWDCNACGHTWKTH